MPESKAVVGAVKGGVKRENAVKGRAEAKLLAKLLAVVVMCSPACFQCVYGAPQQKAVRPTLCSCVRRTG